MHLAFADCCWLTRALGACMPSLATAWMRSHVLERQYTTVEGEREECPFAPPAESARQRSAC